MACAVKHPVDRLGAGSLETQQKEREGEQKEFRGVILDLFNAIRSLPSVRVSPKLHELTNINAIAVVGSSGAGKSTLISAIRAASAQLPGIEIPLRYTTRPPRLNDSSVENQHVTREFFAKQMDAKRIGVHWIREMESGRKEWYGFAATNKRHLPIYSANNDFLKQLSAQDESMRKTTLVLGVYATDQVREERLAQRSPDIQEKERKYRLGDSSENILPFSHLVIDNWNGLETNALTDVVALVKAVVKCRLPWGEIRDIGNHQSEHLSRLFNIVNHDVLFSAGAIKRFQYVERSPGVRSLVTDGTSILMTREWREETNRWDYRLPGGKLYDTAAEYQKFLALRPTKEQMVEKAEVAAKKELQEETGLKLDHERFSMEHISVCGSIIKWDLYYFVARLATKPALTTQTETDEGEKTLNLWLTYEEVEKLCFSGDVSEDRTVAFLLKYLNKAKATR